jgi:hypothetical protein
MARPSSIHRHPARKEIESGLRGGVPYRELAVRHNVSISALSRYSRGPFADAVRESARASGDIVGSDVLRRVLDLADDAAHMRERALRTGNSNLALKTSVTELRALATVATMLGLDSDDLIREATAATSAARELARGVVLAAREDSAVGVRVLSALDADGATNTANQLRDLLTVHAPSLTHKGTS